MGRGVLTAVMAMARCSPSAPNGTSFTILHSFAGELLGSQAHDQARQHQHLRNSTALRPCPNSPAQVSSKITCRFPGKISPCLWVDKSVHGQNQMSPQT